MHHRHGTGFQKLEVGCLVARDRVTGRRRQTLCTQARNGTPRPIKMGNILSPWRYDAAASHALQLAQLGCPAILRYAFCIPNIVG